MTDFDINGLSFKINDVEQVHNIPELDFMELVRKLYPQAEYIPTPDGRQLIYIDNNSNILGIAHLDGTMNSTHFAVGTHYSVPEHTCIFSPFVDDRLGAYTLLYLLPQLNINVDILLSVGEEVGDPTSRFFTPKEGKVYNWMFQFDRKGTDAVCYQYTGEEWLAALVEKFGTIYYGAFSDISFMGHLGIQGINIGTGYHDYTGPGAWASLNELTEQVNKFHRFYLDNKDIHYQFNERKFFQTGAFGKRSKLHKKLYGHKRKNKRS